MRGSSDPRTAIHAAAGAMPKREAEKQMRPAREPLGIGIKQHNRQRHRRKPKRKPVQLRSRQHKNSAGDHNEGGDKSRGEQTNRQSARGRARIGRVNRSIGQPVERHRRRPRRNHGDDDPCQLMPRWAGRRAASIAPQRANGSAKIECSHLIISSVIFKFCRKPTADIVKQPW